MNKTELIDFISRSQPEARTKECLQFAEAEIAPGSLRALAALLKEDSGTSCDFLECISGVDNGKELGVVYHLTSTRHGHTVVLKVWTADRENPVVDSLSDMWKGADFLEREVYDLLGISFQGHPDLRRLFLDKSWGFPLRKDYSDEINIVTK
jgi:NADH-quinone oxidoreductase subunit C